MMRCIFCGPCEGIKVVFTDINMPGDMDGLTLAHYVRQHWPHMVIIVSSGKRLPTLAALPVGARFLAKPVTQAAMALLCNDIKEQLSSRVRCSRQAY